MFSPSACLGLHEGESGFWKEAKVQSSFDKSSSVVLLIWVRDRMWH